MLKTNKIEVLGNGTIQVRQLEVLELTDGTTRDGGFHRYVLTPDTDINTIEDPKVKAIAEVTWKQDVIDAYNIIISETTLGI